MARAARVWVVVHNGCIPIAAFTVRHELLGWAEHNLPADARVWRVTDGGGRRIHETKDITHEIRQELE